LSPKLFWPVVVLAGGILAAAPLESWSQTQLASKPPAAKANTKAAPLPAIWKSATTGKEYRVQVKGDLLTAEWLNIPPEVAKQGAYIRSECRRQGSRWVGTSRVFEPCELPAGKTKMCLLVLRFEVDFISPDRITGGGESLHGFDCTSCEVRQTGWAPFAWMPKR
jgi:hypothetical protein